MFLSDQGFQCLSPFVYHTCVWSFSVFNFNNVHDDDPTQRETYYHSIPAQRAPSNHQGKNLIAPDLHRNAFDTSNCDSCRLSVIDESH